MGICDLVMLDNDDFGIEYNKENMSASHPELQKDRIRLILPSPRLLIRIRRILVQEDYDRYGPINTRYEGEKKKENSIFSFDKQ